VCTMEPTEVLSTSARQPLPAEPISCHASEPLSSSEVAHGTRGVAYVGRLRLPIAGPYRPWARLYRLPDRRRLWVVRLWENDGAVRRLVSTGQLLEFARLNGLRGVAARIRSLDRKARESE
jgi:hypothetical protein